MSGGTTTLADHFPHQVKPFGPWVCLGCFEQGVAVEQFADWRAFAAHQLEMLADAGFTIHKTVTTLAELDALPTGSVVQSVRPNRWRPDIPDVWQRWNGDGDVTDWCPIGDSRWGIDFQPDNLPVRVLWTPKPTS